MSPARACHATPRQAARQASSPCARKAAITPAQALRMFTRDAAYLQFEETEKGTLAPGKRADFVVLTDSPLTVAPERIAAIRVLRTVCGGRTTYDAEGNR